MAWINSRFSTLQLNLFNRQQVELATTNLQKAAQEMTTGRKVDVYSDLGPMAAVTLSLRTTELQTQAYMTSNGVLSSKIEAMMTAVDSVRESVSGIFQNVSVNASRQTAESQTLQLEAQNALKTIISTMNLSYNGDFLFSGISSEKAALQSWETANPDTMYSPKAVLQSIVGSGPANTTDAAAMIADIDSVFNSSYATDPNINFEATFYNGKPELDGSGNANVRVSARIESNRVLDYGVQANDDAFKGLYKGLAMLASVDVSKFQDENTYKVWMQSAADALSSGISKALTTSTRMGFYLQIIEDTKIRQADLSFIYKTRINNFESVDPYEAATRVKSLETQLQASYSISARLSNLTILNYL
jgi:flagellar hook-associated protein 3 FlgL